MNHRWTTFWVWITRVRIEWNLIKRLDVYSHWFCWTSWSILTVLWVTSIIRLSIMKTFTKTWSQTGQFHFFIRRILHRLIESMLSTLNSFIQIHWPVSVVLSINRIVSICEVSRNSWRFFVLSLFIITIIELISYKRGDAKQVKSWIRNMRASVGFLLDRRSSGRFYIDRRRILRDEILLIDFFFFFFFLMISLCYIALFLRLFLGETEIV